MILTVPEPLTRAISWGLLVGLAFYAADGSAAVIENRLRVEPRPLVTNSAPVAVTEVAASAPPPPGVAKLLATTQPPATPSNGTAPSGSAGGASAPVQQAPPANLKLRGTMAGVGGAGLAMIDINGVTEVIGVGEEVAGMTLAEVNAFSARLEGQGRSQILEMDVATSLPAPVVMPEPSLIGEVVPGVSPSPIAADPSVEETPAGEVGAIMSQTELRNILDNPSAFAAQGFRLKPVMRDGEIVGMRVSMRDASHPLARLGVQNGDIVRSLNGTPLNGPEALSSIYRVLRNTSNLSFDVERNGAPQNVNVTLTE